MQLKGLGVHERCCPRDLGELINMEHKGEWLSLLSGEHRATGLALSGLTYAIVRPETPASAASQQRGC